MAREFLTGIKSENRLSNIRLIMPNDPVIGGQPSDNADEFTSNTPFLDLACSIKYSIDQAVNAQKKADQVPAPVANNFVVGSNTTSYKLMTVDQVKTLLNVPAVTSTLSDSTTLAASIKAVNDVNRAANTAQTTANNADAKAVAAQNTANTANTAAKNADTKATNAATTASTADSKAVAAQKTADGKMDIGAFGLGNRSEDYGVTINRDFDQLELITQFFTVSGAWLNSPIKATSTAITGICATIARKYDAGITLRVDLYIEQGHFYRERHGTVWGDWNQLLSAGDFGIGGKLSLTGNIFDKEFSGFYRDQSATLYPTPSNINALSVGYGANRMNGIMFQAASLDAWIFENATRKTAKIITTADLDSLIQVPVDQIFYFDSATPPAGYIARNGQAIDKAKMPKLFARYGANMPDDRDRVHRMTGTLAGAVGTTQEDAIKQHGHILFTGRNDTGNAHNSGSVAGHVGAQYRATYNEGDSWIRDVTGSITANETRVKSRIIIACNKIQ